MQRLTLRCLFSLSQLFAPDSQLFPLNSVNTVISFLRPLEISAGPPHYYVFSHQCLFWHGDIRYALKLSHRQWWPKKKKRGSVVCLTGNTQSAVSSSPSQWECDVTRDFLHTDSHPSVWKKNSFVISGEVWALLVFSLITVISFSIAPWRHERTDLIISSFFFCFWASITTIVAKSFFFCQWAQFYTLLWFRIHPRRCSTSPS